MKAISKSYKRLVAAEIQINHETLLAMSVIKRRLATSGWHSRVSENIHRVVK